MAVHLKRFIISLVALGWLLSIHTPPVEASCGAVSCFVVIGSQQQVPMIGLLTVNAIYNYTPLEAPSGQGGSIPIANQGNQTLTLANLNASQYQDRLSDRIRLCNGDAGLCRRAESDSDARWEFCEACLGDAGRLGYMLPPRYCSAVTEVDALPKVCR